MHTENMKHRLDLSLLNWTVTGFIPFEWEQGHSMELGVSAKADVESVPASVPGSVQKALLQAGIIADWNLGLNAKLCEWVENRHWLYEAQLPDEWFFDNKKYRLVCEGLDYCGRIYINGKEVHHFKNSFIPHVVELTEHVRPEKNTLQIMFESSPRWLGQFHYTSRITEWKPRFNYTWDWTSRLVQIGIWDNVFIESYEDAELVDVYICTDYHLEDQKGQLTIDGSIIGAETQRIQISLSEQDRVIRSELYPCSQFVKGGIRWDDLAVEGWYPNGLGSQPLYELKVALIDENGQSIDAQIRTIGFKNIEWHPCEAAPQEADPWICVVNGKPVFLQGVNWTPIRPNFADVTPEDYRKRLENYRDMGCNLLRVWGGAFLEKECFYNLCDEYGLMVWQEFPLSSSGVENYAPDEPEVIEEFVSIAESYLLQRHHHVSMLIWSGGNELTTRGEDPKPLDENHPLLGKIGDLIRAKKLPHRYIATSPTGPEFFANQKNYGKGLHWDIHGPWRVDGPLDEAWESYWQQDDSLFRSEMGAPGPSPVDIIEGYRGECNALPADLSNPIWKRTGWWVEAEQFKKEHGRKPETLDEYVKWGQQRQVKILQTAVKYCKDRFPRCGGVLIWMGHDCFPCTANTSILDFEGNLKPAAQALKNVFRGDIRKES